jgi:hypothetical protein
MATINQNPLPNRSSIDTRLVHKKCAPKTTSMASETSGQITASDTDATAAAATHTLVADQRGWFT